MQVFHFVQESWNDYSDSDQFVHRGMPCTITAYNFFPENLDEGQRSTAFQEKKGLGVTYSSESVHVKLNMPLKHSMIPYYPFGHCA